MKITLAITSAIALLSLQSLGQIRLDDGISSGGSGCPAGTAITSFNSQRREIQIDFQDYVVVAGKNEATNLDRKACALTIPVEVAAGYQVALGTVTLNGGAAIAQDAKGTIAIEAFVAGARGETIQADLAKGRRSFRVSTAQAKPVFSGCGQGANLRVNTSALVRAGASSASSAIVIKKAGIRLPLIVRACK